MIRMPDIKDELSEARKARQQMVAQGNELIRHARNHLTAQEQNIVHYLISTIKPKDTDFKPVTFTIQYFCELCGIDYEGGKNHRDIKKALKSLADKSIWIEPEEEVDILIRWVDTYEIRRRPATVTAWLSQSIKPYLLNLIKQGNYTQSELVSFLALRSMYSKRLFEILKSYQHKNYGLTIKEFELEELKKLSNAEKYKIYNNFKQKVLDIAMKEINETTDIEVRYTALKEGRKYAKISFTIQRKQPMEKYKSHILAENKLDT